MSRHPEWDSRSDSSAPLDSSLSLSFESSSTPPNPSPSTHSTTQPHSPMTLSHLQSESMAVDAKPLLSPPDSTVLSPKPQHSSLHPSLLSDGPASRLPSAVFPRLTPNPGPSRQSEPEAGSFSPMLSPSPSTTPSAQTVPASSSRFTADRKRKSMRSGERSAPVGSSSQSQSGPSRERVPRSASEHEIVSVSSASLQPDSPTNSDDRKSISVTSLSVDELRDRRKKHSNIEARRRERMNKHYKELDALLVKADPSLGNVKRDRDVILVNAIRILENLLASTSIQSNSTSATANTTWQRQPSVKTDSSTPISRLPGLASISRTATSQNSASNSDARPGSSPPTLANVAQNFATNVPSALFSGRTFSGQLPVNLDASPTFSESNSSSASFPTSPRSMFLLDTRRQPQASPTASASFNPPSSTNISHISPASHSSSSISFFPRPIDTTERLSAHESPLLTSDTPVLAPNSFLSPNQLSQTKPPGTLGHLLRAGPDLTSGRLLTPQPPGQLLPPSDPNNIGSFQHHSSLPTLSVTNLPSDVLLPPPRSNLTTNSFFQSTGSARASHAFVHSLSDPSPELVLSVTTSMLPLPFAAVSQAQALGSGSRTREQPSPSNYNISASSSPMLSFPNLSLASSSAPRDFSGGAASDPLVPALAIQHFTQQLQQIQQQQQPPSAIIPPFSSSHPTPEPLRRFSTSFGIHSASPLSRTSSTTIHPQSTISIATYPPQTQINPSALAMLSRFYRCSSINVIVLDANAMICNANEVACHFLGLPADHLKVSDPLQPNFLRLLHSEDISSAVQDFTQLANRARVSVFATRRLKSSRGNFEPVNILVCLHNEGVEAAGYECAFVQV